MINKWLSFTHIEIFVSASDIESWLASFVDYFCYLWIGTVSGSGPGPLDYGATGPVPDL